MLSICILILCVLYDMISKRSESRFAAERELKNNDGRLKYL